MPGELDDDDSLEPSPTVSVLHDNIYRNPSTFIGLKRLACEKEENVFRCINYKTISFKII